MSRIIETISENIKSQNNNKSNKEVYWTTESTGNMTLSVKNEKDERILTVDMLAYPD